MQRELGSQLEAACVLISMRGAGAAHILAKSDDVGAAVAPVPRSASAAPQAKTDTENAFNAADIAITKNPRFQKWVSFGLNDEAVEGLASCVFDDEHRPPVLAHEVQRPHGPRAIQLILQAVFVGEAIEARGRGVLRGGLNNQHRAPVVVIAQAPPSAEDAFAVLPQNLTAAIRIHAA